ncbi:MAG: precorrin-8X methylmutase [Parvibaculaceae bacterium]
MIDYLRDPEAIYARSFAMIRAEADLSAWADDDRNIAERVIHACGMPDIVADLRISEGFADAARSALTSRRPIIADCEMVRQGIIASRLPRGIETLCLLNDPRSRSIAAEKHTTRSAAAVSLWTDHLEGALVVIGNAPTALFALLEALDAGAPRPAAIIAFPVGFVGAAESKAELLRDPRGCPYATLLGRRGGSAMASSVVNAIAGLT